MYAKNIINEILHSTKERLRCLLSMIKTISFYNKDTSYECISTEN